MDDLLDAALGHLGGSPPDAATNEHQDATAPALIADYELSQIVLVPTSDWDSGLLGLGNRYDVYDGQQRLVTLNLLLAGLRDSFQREADAPGGSGKRSVALAATAHEIGGMLRPTKVRKEDVLRITLRKRDNVLLARILLGNAGTEEEDSDDNAIPTHRYSKLTPKAKAQLLSPLSSPNTRIFHNFVHLTKRLALLTTRERLRLLDYVVERVYLLVCIPETSRIARNIVMSQGRKGMDNEPVDDFKGLVCFRYTLEEEEMYRTFDRWDALAAEPTAAAAGAPVAAVGRDAVSAACLLRASAALRTKIRTRGGDEVFDWERWLRQELWLQNQHPTPGQEPWQGRDFFAEEIRPAAVALYKFRTGQWEEFSFLSKTSKHKMTKRQRETVVAQLNFLRDLTTGVASAKEAQIAVLELLLRAEDGEIGGGMLSRYLDELLPLVETWTLWMALTRPSPMQRHARVFALLDAMDDLDSVGSLGSAAAAGAPSSAGGDAGMAVQSLRECMDEYEFGATAGGKRLAAAILKRMNAHLMIEEKRSVPEGDKASTASVDLIEQQWPHEEEREEWSHRLGNLALVSAAPRRSGRAKKTVADASWESKSQRYKKEPWSLTRQLAELDQWDMDTLRDHQRELLSLMDLVWDLESITVDR